MMEANNDLIFPKYLQLELFRERILVSRATKIIKKAHLIEY